MTNHSNPNIVSIPPAPVYSVSINGEEPIEDGQARAAKRVADNIYTGRLAEVTFLNIPNAEATLREFNTQVTRWLAQVGHHASFKTEGRWPVVLYSLN
jgi:hypothetical protein